LAARRTRATVAASCLIRLNAVCSSFRLCVDLVPDLVPGGGNILEHHAEVLRGGVWHPQRANWRDLVALVLIVTSILLIGSGARQMFAPFAAAHQPEISLSPSALPNYALRTTMRMLAALVASLLFTFTYGTLAAKSRRAEMVLRRCQEIT